ncbi:MAG TPA: ATP-dependent helicase HrpB [Geobacteraceae bacterium]
MPEFPIDHVLPQFLDAVQHHPAVVVQAPPGAGKTTRIPLALLGASFFETSRIVMLEPRRLAATNAARWMASCLGDEVGRTVGYQIRYEKKTSAATRVEVVTEGILIRRLQADPALSGVGVVIFDEFHERSLQSDLALTLCRDVQSGLRDDLKIVVMSATLDSGPLAAFLGNAPIVSCVGRSYPVEVRHVTEAKNADLPTLMSDTVVRALGETHGDILAFLPGAGEIRRCHSLLEERCRGTEVLLVPLFGDLPFEAQEKAIVPARQRKVVLATNIAETSLTIEGVRVVVDGGWCRRLRFDAATGLDRLVTERISAASATQRCGRAGRLSPGVCYRLWSEHQQRALVPYHPPEICTADLANLALDLALWGISDPQTLDWPDPPPTAAFGEARRLLVQLGAIDSRGMITADGRRMAELPIHPRLAHLVLTAHKRGGAFLGCDLAALLSERDIFVRRRDGGSSPVSDSDILDRLEALGEWRRGKRGGSGGVADPSACRAVDRAARQLRTIIGADGEEPATAEVVGTLLAAAYPDRVAGQREPGSDRYLLANGRGGRLSELSAVRNHPYIVAIDMEGGERGDGTIRKASAIALDTLRQECADAIVRSRVVAWNEGEGRVVAQEEERLGAILLSSRPITPTGEEVCRVMLEGVAAGPGLAALGWTPKTRQLRARIMFLSSRFPEDWPDLSDRHLLDTMTSWLAPYIRGVRSRVELAKVDLEAPLRALLTWEQSKRLDEGAPPHISVPSGSRIMVDYLPEEGPVLAVKLQELFGLAETPRVAFGEVPLLIHLLSPAGRPMQVTRDLKNFWNAVYPQVKKELKGRYPKHPWPDDPWRAEPTRYTKKRG